MEENKICNGCGKTKERSFAMEVCRKLKSKARKWCFIACIEFALLVSVVIGFILKG
jgi:hypothetical protein